MNMTKRLLCALLALMLCLSLMPMSALADGEPAESEEPIAVLTDAALEPVPELEAEPEEVAEAVSETETTPESAANTEQLPVDESVLPADEPEPVDPAAGELTEDGITEGGSCSGVVVNPLYADVIDPADIPLPEPGIPTDGDVAYATVEAAASVMREQLVSRNGSVSITYFYTGNATNDALLALAVDIFNAALTHTGNPVEGDYLAWQYGGYGYRVSYRGSGSSWTLTLEYTITYYTTAAQETAMNTAVTSLLDTLALSAKTDYQKVCAIYDYMCDNITYDYDNLYDDTYDLKYTAYAALIHDTAVCQGYAVLFYRLALELGVDARVITSVDHAWNIVELDGKYYNLDATWDAGMDSYSWFLRCPANFTEHPREAEYTTTAFNTAYPMATTDYSPVIPGDIDGNGKVRTSDARMLMRYLVDTDLVCAGNLDVNADGYVRTSDVRTLMQYLVGKNVTLH